MWWTGKLCRNVRQQQGTVSWPYFGSVGVSLVGTLFWLRILVSHVVYSSILYNVKLCQRILRESDVSVVLAFSWGGAVAAELLATRADDRSSTAHCSSVCAYLLMAPTTSVVASLNLFQPRDAALRISTTISRCVSVVHATADPVLCPNPERWQGLHNNNSNRFDFTMLRDNHVFMRSSNERALKEILHRLLQHGCGGT